MAGSGRDNGFQRALTRFTDRLTGPEREEFRFSTLEDVYDTIHQIQEVHGSEKRLRNLTRIKSFLEAMEQYGKVVEVFLNATDLLAFIWGPIKFLLQVASTWTESFDTLLDAYDQISENIPQFLQYQTLFNNNSHMRKILELIYGDILEFHKPWRQLFHATWKTFRTQFQYILSSLCRHKNLIESQASLVEFEQSQAARLAAQKSFEEIAEAEKKRRFITVTEKIHPPNSHTDQEHAAEIRRDFPEAGRWLLLRDQVKEWMDPLSTKIPLLWLNGIPGAGKTVIASLIIEEVKRLDSVSLGFFYCKHSDNQKNSFISILRGLLAQPVHQNEDLLSYVYEKCSSSSELTLESSGLLKDLMEMSLKSSASTYIIIDGLDECERGESEIFIAWFTSMIGIITKDNPGAFRLLCISQRDDILIKLLAKAPVLPLDAVEHQKEIESYALHWTLKIRQKFDISALMEKQIATRVAVRAGGMYLFAKLVLTNLYSQTSRARLNKELHPDKFPEGLDGAYERIINRIYHNPIESEREDAKKLIAWIVCAKRPLKWHEIQAVFSIEVESQTVDFDERQLRVTSKDLGGSLIEIHPGNTIELVHDTARLYLIHTSRISILSQETEIASFCLQYLNFECFNANLPNQRIHDFISEGYYSFEDYAIVHWIDHLESCTHDLPPDDACNLQHVAELVETFVQQHWLTLPPEYPIAAVSNKKFQCFKEWGISEKLELLVNMASQKKTSEKHLDIEVQLQRRRSVFEQLIATLPGNSVMIDRLTSFYGSGWFKCPRPWCDWFYGGFSDPERRNKHVIQHNRPFHCTFAGCPVTEIGCKFENDLKRHISEYHSITQDIDWKFPARRIGHEVTIFQAAAKGNLETVERLVEEGVNIDQTSRPKGGITALYLAAENNQHEIVHFLLKKGVNMNFHRRQCGTALQVAAALGHDTVVQLLLEMGAQFSTKNRSKYTALHRAANNGHEAVIRLLLEKGADTTAEAVDGRTALHLASQSGHEVVVRLLLEKGAEINAKDKHEQEPLYLASISGYEVVVRLLLEKGAEVDATATNQWTPLHRAAIHGRETVVRLLLEKGADITAETIDGTTALQLASGNGHEKVMRLLLEKGANINIKNSRGDRALHRATRIGSERAIRLLLEYGADIEAKNNDEQTALHLTSQNGQEMVTSLLVEAGADINVMDSSGETALYRAIENGHQRIAQLLVQHGAILR